MQMELNIGKQDPAVGEGRQLSAPAASAAGAKEGGARHNFKSPEPERDPFSDETMHHAVEILNEAAATLNYAIEFEVLPDENIIQARINDGKTGELVRAIPPDEVLVVQKKIEGFIGLLFERLA